MKNYLLMAVLLCTAQLFAQVSFNTGNKELDADLNIINKEGNADYRAFKRNLSIDYKIPVAKLDKMKVSFGMTPGEIYFALEIAKNSPSTLDDVLRIYESDKSKGWGYIAKEAGIKPGSPAFHQLKNNAKAKKSKGKPKKSKARIHPLKNGKPHQGRK